MAQMRPTTLLTLTLLLSLATAAKPELPIKKVLTLDAAKKIAAAAEAEATKRKATVVIVVVDDGGHLLLLERLDDTQVASVEVGIGKARTAAIFRRPSKVFEDQVRDGRVAALALPGATPLQSVRMLLMPLRLKQSPCRMQQRGERHVERLASVSERAVDHIETMNGPEILNSVDQIEKLDKVARRTCGRSPRVASPARQEPFRPPDETGSCPKISLRTICSGSSAGWSVSPRQSQRAFESTGISRIILGFPSDRLALRQVVALPASS